MKKRKIKPRFRLSILAMRDEKLKPICQALINAMDEIRNADDKLWTNGVKVNTLTETEIVEVQRIFLKEGFASVLTKDLNNRELHIMFDRIDTDKDFIVKMLGEE